MRRVAVVAGAAVMTAILCAAGGQRAEAARLLVSSVNTDNVLEFDGATGAFVGVLAAAGSGGLDNPGGLAIGPDQNLYVSSRATGNVLRFHGPTGAFIDVFVPAGSGGLGQPVDLAFGPDGHLYVSNLAGVPDNILRYDGASGAFINVFATEATFNTPRHIEFAAGVLWASGEADRIWRFHAVSGAFINKPLSDNPRGLDLGADGLMYVGTSFSGVFRHDAGTGAIADTFIPGLLPLGDHDLAFGPDGHLYVSGGDRVRRFDAVSAAFIEDFVPAGSGGLSDGRYFVFTDDVIVPEPSAVLLLGSGLAVLAAVLGWRRVMRPRSRRRR